MFVSSSNLVTTVAFLIVGSLLLLLGGGPSTSFGSGVVAFQIPLARPHGPLASLYGMTMSTKTERFLSSPSPSEQYEPEDEEATDETPALAVVAAAASKAVEEESPSYPLDVPSPILLASSMVIAIASTGTCTSILLCFCQTTLPCTSTGRRLND